ncbi:hypothetical protein IHE45_08G129400 [Dioscorea alata]|uniref:Uncharacterized protein n=2 Tax=Dioscorea alata TaxID=55571 RepID=A0ACB7VM45_DIOAL|nr:hypothetical protein IHE45_08G129400 [Dioscorea alata]KAH7675344.1 hypothetical protein IHE45_08G129400 [Dioscorea alata]
MEMNPVIDQEMENLDDDDVLLPLPYEQEQLHPSTPAIPQGKLKRLKKASSSSDGISLPDPPESRKTPDFEVSVLKYVGLEKQVDPDDGIDPLFGDLAVSGRPGSHDFAKDGEGEDEGGSDGMEKEIGGAGKVQKEMDLDDGLDPLFGNPVVSEGWESHDFGNDGEDENDGGTGGGEGGNKMMDKLIGGLGKEKSARKRLSWDGGEEDGLKKKKKGKIKNEKPKESVREKRKLEKERKAYVEQIHSESQRILRETRDASFKPAPIVHKPISSVLERIRIRKLELLKQCSVESDSFAGANCSVEVIGQASNLCIPKSNDGEILESDDQVAGAENCNKAFPGVSEDAPFHKPSDEDLNDPLQHNSDDTLDLENVPKHKNGENSENGPLDDIADDILADNLTSSLPISSSKLKSDDDLSSSHEDSDKENNDPYPCKVLNKGSYPKDGLAKTYVDDEAEEEDDSDHDLMRFQESEDDDSDENEVLDDLIMSGYEEAPVEHEKRNQLHQKWLEQQDANETDNVLQRLNCGQIRREPSIIDDEDDNVDTDDEDSADEMTEDQIPANLVRKNSKKAKQMMAQMFTDETDVYVSSEDEETERSLIREHLLHQKDLGPSFISPIEDEHSKKVSGLIKKLNIAPDYKKKGKMLKSSLDMLITDTNSNSSSKSSFLARAQSNSLPASHKQGSITVRTFVFGRDDSSSRSSFSASENIDANQQNNQPLKTPGARYSSRQSKATSLRAKAEVKTNSSSSLFEILKSSSIGSEKKIRKDQSLITESQSSHQFSAFKLVKKSS